MTKKLPDSANVDKFWRFFPIFNNAAIFLTTLRSFRKICHMSPYLSLSCLLPKFDAFRKEIAKFFKKDTKFCLWQLSRKFNFFGRKCQSWQKYQVQHKCQDLAQFSKLVIFEETYLNLAGFCTQCTQNVLILDQRKVVDTLYPTKYFDYDWHKMK